jgi:hypothetical protein
MKADGWLGAHHVIGTSRKASRKLLGWDSARPGLVRGAEEATHAGTMFVPRQDCEERDA